MYLKKFWLISINLYLSLSMRRNYPVHGKKSSVSMSLWIREMQHELSQRRNDTTSSAELYQRTVRSTSVQPSLLLKSRSVSPVHTHTDTYTHLHTTHCSHLHNLPNTPPHTHNPPLILHPITNTHTHTHTHTHTQTHLKTNVPRICI